MKGTHYISSDDGQLHIIDINTLGQYAWLEDRKKKKIYENDIINCTQKQQSQLGEVIFIEWGFFREFNKGHKSFLFECVKKWEWEIVWNIFENSKPNK
mgnify:FL=1